jgi:hypothetical protein
MSLMKYAYAAFAGTVMVTSGAALRAGNECCSDSAGCWELHNWNTDYMCCYPPPGTGPCFKDVAEGYCKDTGGEWCT